MRKPSFRSLRAWSLAIAASVSFLLARGAAHVAEAPMPAAHARCSSLAKDGPQYTYDEAHRLTDFCWRSESHHYEYDLVGNLVRITERDAHDVVVRDAVNTFNERGLPLTVDDSIKGVHLVYTYGANGMSLADHSTKPPPAKPTKADSTSRQVYYLLDAQGSPIATMSEGAITSRTRYGASGEIIAQQDANGVVTYPNNDGTHTELANADDQPIGFTGYYKDTETGLYYAKARYYDPRVGRFTTQDPEEGNPMQPPSLHRYLYAYANPLSYIDATGRASEPLNAYDDERLIPPGTAYYPIERNGRLRYYNADPNVWPDAADYAGLRGRIEAGHVERQYKAFNILDLARQTLLGSKVEKATTVPGSTLSIAAVEESDDISQDIHALQQPARNQIRFVSGVSQIGQELLCGVHPVCSIQEAYSGQDQDGNQLSNGERVLAASPMAIGVLRIGPEVNATERALVGEFDVLQVPATDRLRNTRTGRFMEDPAKPPSPYVFTDAQRRAAWKRLAEDESSSLTPSQRQQIKERGWRGPRRVNSETGETETMELSHEPTPLREGGTDLVPRWPEEHAAIDPYRKLKGRDQEK